MQAAFGGGRRHGADYIFGIVFPGRYIRRFSHQIREAANIYRHCFAPLFLHCLSLCKRDSTPDPLSSKKVAISLRQDNKKADLRVGF